MNFISRLISRQPSGVKVLATLGDGEFSIVRSEDSPRGRRELILKDAQLDLVSTTREFFVQLQVRDLSREDELSSADPNDSLDLESEDENSFLVHQDLKLGYFLAEGRIVITWRDLDGEDGTMFEFLCSPNVSREALSKFDRQANIALYGQKYGTKPAASAPDSLFDEFQIDYSGKERLYHIDALDPEIVDVRPAEHTPDPEPSLVPSSEAEPPIGPAVDATVGASNSTVDLSNSTVGAGLSSVDAALSSVDPGLSSVVASNSSVDPSSTADASNSKDSSTAEGHALSPGRIMASADCILCVYDSAKDAFKPAFVGATVVVLDQNNYEYFLEVRKNGRAILGMPVHDDLNQYIDIATKSLIFNYSNQDDNDVVLIMSYLLKFADSTSLAKIESQLSVAQFEARNRRRFTEVTPEQQTYLINALKSVNLNDVDMPDADLGDAQERDNSEDEEEDEDDFEETDAGEDDEEGRSDAKNSALEVGHVNDRAYVLRGNKIGVFKNGVRDLKYSTTIENVGVDPSRIMLHEKDRALVIQNRDDPRNLYRMDLETGKIVDTWSTGRDVVDFNAISKFAPTTEESNLFAVSDKALFRIDPRLQSGRVDSGTSKVYKSDLQMSKIVTTASGFIVAGTKKGEIRLWDKIGTNATTLIPGLGDPIVGLDVTADGQYVLATCPRYLLLIQVVTEKYNGYTSRFVKADRALPRKLQISPENLMFMTQQSGMSLNFTPARFNTGIDAKEETIVTSTGPYLVTWNLRQVLRNERNCYKIKKYTSEITSENFKYGTDKRVILTLADDVNMVAKSALKTPNSVLKAQE